MFGTGRVVRRLGKLHRERQDHGNLVFGLIQGYWYATLIARCMYSASLL